MLKKICALVVFVNLVLVNAKTQDLHYSQFYYNYHNLSPSLIGNYGGNDRVTLNYRNQWASVPVPYNTISFLYDGARKFKNSQSSYGFGLGLDYDRAGDSKLNIARFVGAFNYMPYLNKRNKIMIAVSPSIAQRRLSSEELRWGNQWTGDHYNKDLPSKENYSVSGDFFLDLGAGLSYEFRLTNRTKINLSGAAFHLNRPDQSFYGITQKEAKLPIRYSLSTQIGIGIFSIFDLIISGNYQLQEEYRETIGSGLLRIRINQTPGQILNVLAGCNIRLDDALIPTAGIEFKNWMVSVSYDINTSFFNVATNKKGGPELAVQYVFANINKSGIYKKCPLL